MSVITREAPKLRKAARNALRRYLPVLRQAGAVLGAYLAAGAPLFGGLRPLGLCIAACVAPGYALCAAAGAAIGYLRALPVSDAAPYLAAVVAVVLLRLLGGAARYEDTPMTPAVAGAICLCLIRSGLSVSVGNGFTGILISASEALLIMGMAYLLITFFSAPRQVLDAQDSETKAAACLAMMTALACLTPFSFLGISLARIASALFVLIIAWRRGSVSATLPGVAAAAVLCAADPASAYAGMGIAVGGLAAGLFLPEGRALTAMVFCGSGFLGVLSAPDARSGLLYMAELCLASLCFTLIPQRFLTPVPAAVGTPAARVACVSLAGRLESLSGALTGVGDTVQQICEKLPVRTESYADLCDTVAQQCCRTCPKNAVCWVECGTDTYDCFNQMAPLIHSAKSINITDLPSSLLRRCSVPAKLAATINTAAARQAARRGLYTRSTTTRAALCEQYGALAATLATLAGQVSMEELPDRRKARRLQQMLHDIGLNPIDVSVARNTAGRIHASALLPNLTFNEAELAALAREASELCRQPLEIHCKQDRSSTTLLFEQRPCYRIEVGAFGIPAKGDISADACQTLTADGCVHAVLCDGMGTGKAAAVDGVMAATLAAQLLSAGFGPAEVARLVNVALTLKSDDESATTMDTATVDLYSGETKLFKAGACPSFLIHEGTISTHGAASVPIGILERVIGDESNLVLTDGDFLILVSDGVLGEGVSWVCSQLLLHAEKSPQALAETLAQAARQKSQHPDDITVVALQIKNDILPTQKS